MTLTTLRTLLVVPTLLMTFACPARAGVHAWSGGTPRGQEIEAIASDPLTPSRMWAAAFGAGVLRSLDGGATWTANRGGLVNTFVRALAVQPRHPDSIYCGSNDGVSLSVDGGLNWSRLLATSSAVRAVIVHPIRTGIVYAATSGNGVYKSINGGKTWSAINLGLANLTVRDVAMDPARPETLFAGASTGGGIHRSFNGGLSWTQSADPDAGTFAVEKIRFDPLDANRIYAATVDAGMLKSSDRGVTWARVNRGLTNFRTRSLDVVDTLRYVGTDGSGVFFTTLSDTLWHPVTTGLSNLVVDALFSRPGSPGTEWAGTDGGGMFTTSNRGTSWSQVDGGSLDTYAFTLLRNPANGHLYDGGGFGSQFWRSTDNGATWNRTAYLFTHDSEHGLAIDPLSAGRLYMSAYGSGVYRSDDDGVTWLRPDSTSGTLTNSFVRDLVAVPGKAGQLYVGTGDGVWQSIDAGTTWARVSTGLPASFSVRSLALVPGTLPTLYAGSDSAGVWKSVDGGAHWSSASSGIPTPFIHALLVHAVSALTVYAGTDSGVYRTTDGGASWAPSRTGLPYGLNASVRAFAQDAHRPQILFAGLYGAGVFESVDGGTTWAPVFGQSGLANLDVRSLALDAARSTILAGTDDGVWSSSLYPTPLAVAPGAPGVELAIRARPNPARCERVTVDFVLPVTGAVLVEVYGLDGGRVRTLARLDAASAGEHHVVWDRRRGDGRALPSGVYFIRLRTPWGERTEHVTLIGG